MNAPELLLGLPLLLAVLAFALRAQRLLVGLFTIGGLGLLVVLLQFWPIGTPIAWLGGWTLPATTEIFGRTFQITPADTPALSFVLSQAAVLFALAGVSRVGRWYVPLGLVVMTASIAALLVRPFLFAAFFIELSATLLVFMLVDWEAPPTRHATTGALRFLVFTTLSVPLILLGGWQLENSQQLPDFNQAILWLGLGLAVLMAVVPFHSWLPAIAEAAPPLATAFVATVARVTSIFLILNFLNQYATLNANPLVFQVLTIAGGLTTLGGSLFAFGQRNFSRVMGYALVIDFGVVLLALGLDTHEGVEAALVTLALRGVALPFWALGLERLRAATGGLDDFEHLQGLAWTHPSATVFTLLGLLSLAGLPLTVGFTGRWALLGLLAETHPTAALIVFGSIVSIALVGARGLMSLVTLPHGQERPTPVWQAVAEPWPWLLGAGLSLALLIGLGLFPQWLLPFITQVTQVFTNL